jgi:hypothetical protein
VNPAAKRALDNERIETNLRNAKPHICPRCRAECLKGDDDDRIALTAVVDVEPIDHVGEMFAILDGRCTYDLVPHGFGGTRRLYSRNWLQWCRAERKYPVHADHRCRPAQKVTLW